MGKVNVNRRQFIKETVVGGAGLVGLAAFPEDILASSAGLVVEQVNKTPDQKPVAPRIKFSVIGLNHGHINSQVEAVIR